jgi:hypothetical protein
MGKHINVLGYSIWISTKTDREAGRPQGEGQSLYSPGVLASYSLLNPSFGTVLYGMNLLRRNESIKGIGFIVISCGFMVFSILVAGHSNQRIVLINVLVALSLYQLERHEFDAAIRNGFCRARWWPPLIGVVIVLFIAWLFAVLLQ